MLTTLCFLKGELVLSGVDGGNQLVLADIQLRGSHGETGLDEFDTILALENFEFGLTLFELLLGLLEVKQGVREAHTLI